MTHASWPGAMMAKSPGPYSICSPSSMTTFIRPVSVLSMRHYQAAQFTDTTTAATIASRHCPLDQLTLAPVPAIEPYLAGYTRFLRRMGQHARASPRG
jgi:hypothetical protein